MTHIGENQRTKDAACAGLSDICVLLIVVLTGLYVLIDPFDIIMRGLHRAEYAYKLGYACSTLVTLSAFALRRQILSSTLVAFAPMICSATAYLCVVFFELTQRSIAVSDGAAILYASVIWSTAVSGSWVSILALIVLFVIRRSIRTTEH